MVRSKVEGFQLLPFRLKAERLRGAGRRRRIGGPGERGLVACGFGGLAPGSIEGGQPPRGRVKGPRSPEHFSSWCNSAQKRLCFGIAFLGGQALAQGSFRSPDQLISGGQRGACGSTTPNFTTADFAFPAGYSNVQKTSRGMKAQG